MSEQNPHDEAQRRAQEIYERLVREQRWDFHNIPTAAPHPQPAPQGTGSGAPA